MLAKTDESLHVNPVITGRYRLIRVSPDVLAKTDECIVEMVAITDG